MSNTLVCDQLPVKLMPFPSASAALTTVIHSFPAIYPCPGCDGSRVGKVVKMNPSRARFSSSSWEGDPGWDIYSLQMFWIYLGGHLPVRLAWKTFKRSYPEIFLIRRWNHLTFGMKQQHFYADLHADIWAPKVEPGYLEETHFVYHLILSVTRSSVRSGM